ncbi:MAG: ubiquitin family protein [Bellilinea sp.]
MSKLVEKTGCITVEFTNLARVIAGEPEIDMEISPEDTYADIVERLAVMYPDLVGILIDPDGRTFLSSNMFIINNEMGDPVMVMNEHPRPGDRLTLVAVATGG